MRENGTSSSTLCGVGAAQAKRVLRGEDARLAANVVSDHPWLGKYLTDVSDEVNTAVTEIVVVLRTFPIRVAGPQAGPLKDEIDWEQLQRESAYPRPIEERTSVTNKVRRVGRFDWELAKSATRANRPTKVAINGLDYLDYRNFAINEYSQLSAAARSFVDQLERNVEAPIHFLGVGPSLEHVISPRNKAETCSKETTCLASAALLGVGHS